MLPDAQGSGRLFQLPSEVLQVEVLGQLLGARSLAAAACVDRQLNSLVTDQLWAALLAARLPRLVQLLERAAEPPAWWAGRSWRARAQALVAGQSFSAQVYNREQENEAEDFLLSAYDATCSLAPASARALLTGEPPAAPLLVSARYLPMGQMPAVVEQEVAPERLRPVPPTSSPFDVYGGGAAASAGLAVGEEVEVQWKGRRGHPFGWWFGTVQAVRGNRVVLVFRQYPRSSVWHRVRAPIKPGREAVLNGDWSFGYVGGLRRLTAEEREEWRRHGAPHPPAPGQLAALGAEAGAAEDEWSDDEDLDFDVDLAAELEAELEEEPLAPAGGAPDAADAPPAGEAAAPAALPAAAEGQPAADPAAAMTAAAAAEDAAPAPAGPPGEPIAMQLGQAAGGAGQPVALAGSPAPQALPLPAEQAQ